MERDSATDKRRWQKSRHGNEGKGGQIGFRADVLLSRHWPNAPFSVAGGAPLALVPENGN